MTESTLAPAETTEVCACSHLLHQHDAVAARYCDATAAAGLQRKCMCAVTPSPPARSYDRR